MNLFDRAQRFIGVRELAGQADHPLIQWWLSLCFDGGRLDIPDETPWCSAFVNGMAWDLRLPRSKSAMARSWLKVGRPIELREARAANDVVILWRISRESATGHVGIFAGLEVDRVLLLGGNQGDAVSVASYGLDRVLGVRRLSE